uniref:Putative salivary mucin 6 n=2 Tax=Aedes albopictus TaxID=7160 RepID=A0A1W7R7H1_AEDAL
MISFKAALLGLVVCLALVRFNCIQINLLNCLQFQVHWNHARGGGRASEFRKQLQLLTLQKYAKDQGIEPPAANDTNPMATIRQRLQQKILDDYAQKLGLSNGTSAAGNATTSDSSPSSGSSNSTSNGSGSNSANSNSTSPSSNSGSTNSTSDSSGSNSGNSNSTSTSPSSNSGSSNSTSSSSNSTSSNSGSSNSTGSG